MKDTKSISTNARAVKSRRKVLKKVGAAGGVVAAAAWSKPTLDMVITPAHAQMSEEMMGVALGGASSSSANPSMTMQRSTSSPILNTAAAAMVPLAHAGDDGSFLELCFAFLPNGDDDNTHCISLAFDEAVPDANFTLNFTGPDIYYDNCFYDGVYAYYAGSINFSGMASDALDGQSFMVTVGDVDIFGTVADDFQSASGTLKLNDNLGGSNFGSDREGNRERFGMDYGAYWSVNLDGTSCTPGAGVSTETDIITGGVCEEK